MGWWYETVPCSKGEYVSRLCEPHHWTRDDGVALESRTIGKALVGNHLWSVVALFRGGKEVDRSIRLNLLSSHDGCWGNKELYEEVGPYYYDCPLKFLDVTPPSSNKLAVGWRDEVRAEAARAKARAEIAPGQVWAVNTGRKVRVETRSSVRGQWIASTEDHRRFRYQRKQFLTRLS